MGVTEFISKFIFITLNSERQFECLQILESKENLNVFKNSKFFLCDASNIQEMLEMIDKICQCPALDEKQVAMLGDVTQELENLRINEKKQTRIEHFFLKNM